MKSFVALIALATAASAASLSKPLFQRAPAAVCNGHVGDSCVQANQRACVRSLSNTNPQHTC